MFKPAINHIWGLDPKRMQWIYKQIILPRLTYGCQVWGHSLTNDQASKLRSVERLALGYHAPMWKTTPTASLQILLIQKPSNLEVLSVGIKTYIRCKKLFQNNHWDGIDNNRTANNHLKTLKSKANQISHEGIPLDEFESNLMKEPHYSWNPPIQHTLTAVGIDDIDDCFDIDDIIDTTNDNDDSFEAADSAGGLYTNQRMEFRPGHGDLPSGLNVGEDLSSDNSTTDNNDSFLSIYSDASGLSTSNRMEFCPLRGDPTGQLFASKELLSNQPAQPAAVFSQGSVVPQNLLVSTGIS